MPPHLVWLVRNNQRNRIDSLLRQSKSMDFTLRTETHLMNFTIRHCRAAEELLEIYKIIQTMYVTFFNTIFVSSHRYVPREPRRNQSNRRLNEHGIYIRHCQESNSQPVPSQVQADPTRPQWRTRLTLCISPVKQMFDYNLRKRPCRYNLPDKHNRNFINRIIYKYIIKTSK